MSLLILPFTLGGNIPSNLSLDMSSRSSNSLNYCLRLPDNALLPLLVIIDELNPFNISVPS